MRGRSWGGAGSRPGSSGGKDARKRRQHKTLRCGPGVAPTAWAACTGSCHPWVCLSVCPPQSILLTHKEAEAGEGSRRSHTVCRSLCPCPLPQEGYDRAAGMVLCPSVLCPLGVRQKQDGHSEEERIPQSWLAPSRLCRDLGGGDSNAAMETFPVTLSLAQRPEGCVGMETGVRERTRRVRPSH